jgi:hypothetical protein
MKVLVKTFQQTNPQGETEDVHIVLCPYCDKGVFLVFVTRGHQHLQCIECNRAYCEGGCRPKEEDDV